MPEQFDKSNPRILYSCYAQLSREGEQFIPEHVFGYILSGSQTMHVGDKSFQFKAGDLRLFRKNQLCKFTKIPPPGGEFISLSAIMDKDTLLAISNDLNIHADGPYTGDSTLLLQPNELFSNYVTSLSPYINNKTEISKALTGLKVKEAVIILLETHPELKNLLFDFAEPGKIDLEAFMTKHYKYNVDISRFAYLTGRSLATFKRDFERIFQTSPNRWLQQKRLTDAHYLIKEKGWRSSDVYMEVGFKDLSHFSFAFKKAYGVSPSSV